MKDDGSSDFELKRILGSIAIPFLFISICFALRLLESMNLFSFVELGIYPRHINGLQGVILAPLIHADFYRLDDPAEAEELGLDDYRDGAALIAEWPDHAGGFAHEAGCLSITIEIVGEGRQAIVEPGADWVERLP